MSDTEPSGHLLQFNLDAATDSDPIRIVVLDDVSQLTGLITDTHSWLAEAFLGTATPTAEQLKSLLGPDYELVTLEFVYPATADTQTDAIVQLLVGTNVVTVRTFVSGASVREVAVSGTLDITLYEPVEGDNQGLAYCHQHLASDRPMAEVLADVAQIILDPDTYLQALSAVPDKRIRKVHRSGAGENVTTNPDVCFGIKGRMHRCTNEADETAAELRFLCQRHLPGEGSRFSEGPLPPCVKPSGVYTEDPLTGKIIIVVDTTLFVDYDPVPPAPPEPEPRPDPAPVPPPAPGSN